MLYMYEHIWKSRVFNYICTYIHTCMTSMFSKTESFLGSSFSALLYVLGGKYLPLWVWCKEVAFGPRFNLFIVILYSYRIVAKFQNWKIIRGDVKKVNEFIVKKNCKITIKPFDFCVLPTGLLKTKISLNLLIIFLCQGILIKKTKKNR